MNESDMPREWWHDQDRDEAWLAQQEKELEQYEAERNKKTTELPGQLSFDFDA